MSISTPFIRRPIGTSLLMAAIFLVGLAAYPLLPVAPLPQIEFPTISVTANFPGASPETMASTVASPLETQFAQISGVSQLTSTSVIGTSQITIQFDLSRSVDLAAIDVLEAINAATGSLPKTMPAPPSFKKVNPADSPVLILAVQSDELPITDVDNYAENILAQQLSQLVGVSQVTVGGQQKPAIRIQVDPARLAAMGMTMEDVRGVIATATTNSPKGSIDGAVQSFTIYDNDQILAASRGTTWSSPIATARRCASATSARGDRRAAEQRELAGWQNGKRGVLLLVFKQPGANVIDTVERVKARCRSWSAAFRHRCMSDHHRPHPDHPRLGERRGVHPDAVASGWWCW